MKSWDRISVTKERKKFTVPWGVYGHSAPLTPHPTKALSEGRKHHAANEQTQLESQT